MFRQIKSALIWTYIYRFRKLLLKIFIALLLFVFIEFIYRDIVEYLRLSHNVAILPYVLIAKWALYLLIAFFIFFSVYKTFGKKSDNKGKIEKKSDKKMSKKELALTAEQIIRQKIGKKRK